MKAINKAFRVVIEFLCSFFKGLNNERPARKLELVFIFSGLVFAGWQLIQIEAQVSQGNAALRQGQRNIELLTQQSGLQREQLLVQKRFEELKMLLETVSVFDQPETRKMLEDFRRKANIKGKYDEDIIRMRLLDTLETVQWLTEEKGTTLKDNDVRFTVGHVLRVVCANNYLQDLVETWKYGGIPKLCRKFEK